MYAPFLVMVVVGVTIPPFIATNMSLTFNVSPIVNDVDKNNSGGPDAIVLNTTEVKRLVHCFIPPHLTGYMTSHSIINKSPFASASRSLSDTLKQNKECGKNDDNFLLSDNSF